MWLFSSKTPVSDELKLKRWTMAGLGIAVFIGFLTILVHGDNRTAAISAFGAALGMGGVLGFLFGVPEVKKAQPGSNGRRAKKPARGAAGAPAAGAASAAQGGPTATAGLAAPKAVATDGANDALPASAAAGGQDAPPIGGDGAGGDGAGGDGAGGDGAGGDGAGGDGAGDTDDGDGSDDKGGPSVSNLEQVADWVTKLLLGGGLTQLQRIPPKVWQWARLVALGILRDVPNATQQLIVAQQAFAAGLLVYSFVLGFFAGFLITKLQLGKEL
jgi:hypothetical protein